MSDDGSKVFISTPRKIRGILDNVIIKQISAGETHSLALSEKGIVYGWGYTNAGQLGIGINEDNFDIHPQGTMQIKEPITIDSLSNI